MTGQTIKKRVPWRVFVMFEIGQVVECMGRQYLVAAFVWTPDRLPEMTFSELRVQEFIANEQFSAWTNRQTEGRPKNGRI